MLTEAPPTDLLDRVAADFRSKPFVPPRVLTHGDLQTLGAYFWRGRYRPRDVTDDEERLFQVDSETKVLARCRWQPDRTERATLVLWHGVEGSTTSAYMLATAAKAFAAGFNVARVNIRNCGGTEHLTPTLYHGGMSGDARAVIQELIDRDRLPRIFVGGFSLGGNVILKMAGEYGDQAPAALAGVIAISPSVDLRASSDLLMTRRNLIYHKDFLYYLKRRIKAKEKLFPGRYDSSGLHHIKTLRQFDDTYIAPAFGFAGVDDYYAKASSLPYINRIRVPTLFLQAQDDPLVPIGPLSEIMNGFSQQELIDEVRFAANPHVLLITPARGGHVAFLSAGSEGEDRFWAENRLIDFCRSLTER
ncbi:MAG TPA: alpha/beta fold hydrolase [Pyrinomonadaceae bacterium]|nr:alpha/beta fold hydrolase [Pyrinomonadaceae bacterium]